MDLGPLLDRARAGEPQARDELVARFYDRVAAMVHRQLQSRLRPQQHAVLRQLSTGDFVQEVFVEVLRGLQRWSFESQEIDSETAFSALLATLVEHRVVDQVRRSQAARRDVRREGDAGPVTVGAAAGERGPGTLASNHEEIEIYREVLATFEERERALLALRLEDQIGFAELAERLAYPSPDAARKAFHTAEARLLLRLRQRGLAGGSQ